MEATEQCPHGHGDMVYPVGDPLEPTEPYCGECGHIKAHDCEDGCDFGDSGELDLELVSQNRGFRSATRLKRWLGSLEPAGTYGWEHWGSWLSGGVVLFTYQIALGISLRRYPTPGIRVYLGPVKLWGNVSEPTPAEESDV